MVLIAIRDYLLELRQEAAAVELVVVALLVNSRPWLAHAIREAVGWVVVWDEVLAQVDDASVVKFKLVGVVGTCSPLALDVSLVHDLVVL